MSDRCAYRFYALGHCRDWARVRGDWVLDDDGAEWTT